MCYAVTCKKCGKTTWSGCGQHVDQVMRGVPRIPALRRSRPRAVQRILRPTVRSVTGPTSAVGQARVRKSFSSSSGVIELSSGSAMQLRIAEATIA